MPIPKPYVNGVYYDASSVEIVINGLPYVGVKALTYGDTLAPGEVRGAGYAGVLGRTRGQYSTTAALELWLDDSVDFENSLRLISGGNGWAEVAFDVRVTYFELGRPPRIHELRGCRATKHDDEVPAEGAGTAVSVKYDLHVMIIMRDGVTLFRNPRLG